MPKKFKNDAGRAVKATGIEARRLLAWLENNYEIEGAAPLVQEMLRISRRLQEVRTQIRKDGLMLDGKPNALLGLERQLGEQFLKCWRTLGLADVPQEERRSPGRPPESERRWRA